MITDTHKTPPRTTLTLLLDADVREQLECEATENERSIGAEARVAIRRHLAEHPDQPETAA